MNKVSIVIPAYNCGRFLAQAIDSVLNQTYRDIELIVVDDGSTDDTKDILVKYKEQITYVYQENKGHAQARNTGLKRSSGKYCAFLDADDYWHPMKIELQVGRLERNPQAGIVHCNLTVVNMEGKPLRIVQRKKQFVSGKIFKPLLLRQEHVATSSAMFRKECFEKLGLLDETMKEIGGEDREFWLRISKHYLVEYIDKELVFYRFRKKSLSRTRQMENMIQGRYTTINKSLEDVKPWIYARWLRQKAYSAVHNELAHNFFDCSVPSVARKHYLKSLEYWPFQIRPLGRYLKSLAKEAKKDA